MKTIYKISIAAAAIAAIATVSFAASRSGHFGEGRFHGKEMFKQADANSDGAIVSQELATMLNTRFKEADADGDGIVSKAEIVVVVEKNSKGWMGRHSGKFADMLVLRTDINDNGNVELAELENRTKKVFALMDFNDDGKVEMTEIGRAMPARMGRHHGGWRMQDELGEQEKNDQ